MPTTEGPCASLRNDLANCILRSDCVLLPPHRSPQDCLRYHRDELPEQCLHLRYAFFECKRGMLDMRKRFRGLDPGQHREKAAEEGKVDVA